ncbi:polysaccharide biosynthesis/export family protein [Nevskia sp.]|uniref:SLBB domain-containing protein n=1 Tax=Nevskia sp. TaxID=1929292 RepID=UPI0025D59C08|nr:polysaccharide biosynthesis/export family protein [Nevskia sp.]
MLTSRIRAAGRGSLFALSILLSAFTASAANPHGGPELHFDFKMAAPPSAAPAISAAAPGASGGGVPANAITPLVTLGVGDTVSVLIFGKPDLSVNAVVGDDGSIVLPLIDAVPVAGLSPSNAALRIAKTYSDGEYLVNPQVSVTLEKGTSQQVSVLGEVGGPGRYAVESRTTVFDLLAQAGGKGEDSADIIFLVRTGPNGETTRTAIDLGSLSDPRKDFPTIKFQGGDTLFVPRADQVFIYGEVNTPGQYKLQPGMTLIQALTIAGGVTRRGSTSRIEIKRRKPDGGQKTVYPKLSDPLQADDVIRVKESIF